MFESILMTRHSTDPSSGNGLHQLLSMCKHSGTLRKHSVGSSYCFRKSQSLKWNELDWPKVYSFDRVLEESILDKRERYWGWSGLQCAVPAFSCSLASAGGKRVLLRELNNKL